MAPLSVCSIPRSNKLLVFHWWVPAPGGVSLDQQSPNDRDFAPTREARTENRPNKKLSKPNKLFKI